MTYSFTNLLNPQNLGSGVAEKVYLAPVRWFKTGGIKKPEPPFNVPGKRVEILQSHEFINNYGFVQMQLQPDKNVYDAKAVGERETQKFQHSLNIFLGGSYAVLHETMMACLNEPFIALIYDSNCEMVYQLGDAIDHAWMKPDFTTGTNADGAKGYNASLAWVAPSLLLYKGTITVNPNLSGFGDFNPADFLNTDYKTE